MALVKNYIMGKILLKYQDSWIINGGKTTKHFLLGKGARQDKPISALFLLIKTKLEIAWLTIFNRCCLYSAYFDDNFFLKAYHFYKRHD